MRFLIYTLAMCLALILPASAQDSDEDKGYLTNLLEDSLGGDGRDVQINGFAGAFSSRATINSITIADNNGIWLRLDEVAIDWNRAALLRGRVEVRELSAARISLPRLPLPQEEAAPAPEAGGFSLPDLPVAINIARLAAGELVLGEPVLGEEARLSVTAQGGLSGGTADIALEAARIDGQLGQFNIEGRFDGTTLGLELDLQEGENGIVSRLLNLPGGPSVSLLVSGDGPLSDLTTDISLSTDGVERLAGEVTLSEDRSLAQPNPPARNFALDIGGDITALFAPQYRDFFGDEIALKAQGRQGADGALELSQLELDARALNLEGSVRLNRDYWPELLDIEGQIANPSGDSVLLPMAGAGTRVGKVDLSVDYDRATDDIWNARFNLTALERADLQVDDATLNLTGILDGEVGEVGRVTADIDMEIAGVNFADPGLREAVGDSVAGTVSVVYFEDQPIEIKSISLGGSSYGLTGDAVINDLESGLRTEFVMGLEARDLSRFSNLAGQALTGQASLELAGAADLGGGFDISVNGAAEGLTTGITQADAVLSGRTSLAIAALRDENGTQVERLSLRNGQFEITGDAQLATDQALVNFDAQLFDASLVAEGVEGAVEVGGSASQDERGWSVDVSGTGPYDLTADIAGLVTGPNARVTFDAQLPDINPLVPNYRGTAAVQGTARQSKDGWLVDTNATGPYALTASVIGLATGPKALLEFNANLPDIRPIVPGYSGAVGLRGTVQNSEAGWLIDSTASGPFSLSATAAGRVTGQDAPDIRFSANLPNVRPLAPQINGPLDVQGQAQMRGETLAVGANLRGPYALTARVDGPIIGAAPALEFSANLPNVAPLVPQLSGPLNVAGSARQSGAEWIVDTNLNGLSGTRASIAGQIAAAGSLALNIEGNAPLGLANPFLGDRSIQGQAQFDLTVNGPAALRSVSGQIRTAGARVTAPNLQISLENIGATIGLSAGQAQVDLGADLSSGGRLELRGPVTLSGAMPADLTLGIREAVLRDPTLYETRLNGTMTVRGPLQGGARIAGRIDVGETQVNVPSTGLTSFGIIPQIAHVGASRSVVATQDRAGLNEPAAKDDTDGGGAAYPLDILVAAPSRIFVRGRGIDAELGGQLRLTGTTASIISAGRFELIRGRLDILSKRFELDEGSIQLQGDFDPFLRFVATTPTSSGTASIVIEGPASEPRVRFEASPEAPQDQVLAQIFFGRDASQLSAFQALQLANAIATLAGRGGEGIVGGLRRSFALDDLDITTDEDGNAALRAGRYISDNVYTDVEVGQGSGAEVSINIDLTPNLTVRGTAGSDGNTGVGIYFEKDY